MSNLLVVSIRLKWRSDFLKTYLTSLKNNKIFIFTRNPFNSSLAVLALFRLAIFIEIEMKNLLLVSRSSPKTD